MRRADEKSIMSSPACSGVELAAGEFVCLLGLKSGMALFIKLCHIQKWHGFGCVFQIRFSSSAIQTYNRVRTGHGHCHHLKNRT